MREKKVSDLGVDMLTLVGHKFGAPKGVAALFVRKGLALPSMIHGGGQEAGRRAGTENVLLISGMGKAAEVGGADVGDKNDVVNADPMVVSDMYALSSVKGPRFFSPR